MGRAVVRFRWIIVVAWVVFAVACLVTLPTLSSVVKVQFSQFLPASSPSSQAQKASLRFNLSSNTLASFTLVAVSPHKPLTPNDQGAITHLEKEIRGTKRVRSVQDLGVSPDGQAREAQILASVPLDGSGKAAPFIKHLRSLFTSAGTSGITYHLTGQTAENYDMRQQTAKSENVAQSLSYLVIIVLLLLAFRAILAPVVTIITAGIVLVLSTPIIAELTKIGLQASTVTEGVLIVLVLGAGTDYCVFFLSRMREEMGNGLTAKEAVGHSLATVGESITFSGFTVMAALSTLAIAQYGIYQSLGPPLAVGIALMLLAGLTLLPALLSIFGGAVFWPSRPRASAEHHTGLWARTAERVISYPWATLVVGVAIFVGLSLGSIGVARTGGFSASPPSHTDSGAGQKALEKHFPTAKSNPETAIFVFRSSIWSNPAPAAQAQKILSTSTLFRSVTGPFGPGGLTSASVASLYRKLGPPQALPPADTVASVPPATYNGYRRLAQFFSRNGTAFQVFSIPKLNNVNSQRALNGVPKLRSRVADAGHRAGAKSAQMWGLLPVAYDISQVSSHDLNKVIPIVAVLILLLLAVVLRSLIAPLYLVASVVLSYLATLGFASLIFVRLGGQPNLNFVIPLVIFIFLMALGSDYNILVMTRIREEAAGLPIAEAVKRAIGSTGTSVTTAGLILGGTFAAFGVAAPGGSAGDQSRQIGFGIAAGILMDTFLVRTLLVPSIVVILGRWNWWPSQLWRTEPCESQPAPVVDSELVGHGSR